MEDIIINYLNRLEEIRKSRLMTMGEMIKEIGSCHQTLIRIRRDPGTCSIKTIKKIKKFVDEWEKNGYQ
jgi:DNA-binding XRE family transcriptional regulator